MSITYLFPGSKAYSRRDYLSNTEEVSAMFHLVTKDIEQHFATVEVSHVFPSRIREENPQAELHLRSPDRETPRLITRLE